MKILFTYTGFLPADAWGGPVKIIHQNALELKRRGHLVSIATSNLLNKRERIQPGNFTRILDGIEVNYLHLHNIPQWPGTLGPTKLGINARKRLRQLVEQVDIVHVNAVRNGLAIETINEAHNLGKPIILQPHGTLPHIVNSVQLKQAFDKIFLHNLLNRVDKFIAGQQAEVQQIIDAGGKLCDIHIVANGIAVNSTSLPNKASKFISKLGIPPNKQIILFLGRINRKKGTDLLIEAFAAIPEAIRNNYHLVIAGPDDGQLSEVIQRIAYHGLENQVTFPGLLSGEDVWATYAIANLFVLPCRTDTFPMAIVEACSAGIPMVITDTCEIADLVRDKAATVVTLDVQAIADGIVWTLSDSALQKRYNAGAQELMKTVFSMQAVGDGLENVYKQAFYAKMAARPTT